MTCILSFQAISHHEPLKSCESTDLSIHAYMCHISALSPLVLTAFMLLLVWEKTKSSKSVEVSLNEAIFVFDVNRPSS